MTAPLVSPEVRERCATAAYAAAYEVRPDELATEWKREARSVRAFYRRETDAVIAVLADAGLIRGETK